MGSSKNVLELFAERDIRQLFSEYDGWKAVPVAGQNAAGCFYQLTRGRWTGVETAYLGVSFDSVPKKECLAALDSLPDGGGSKTKKFLLTPQATDTSAVPPHIRVLLMSAFAFSDGNLVWLTKKKNARKFSAAPPAAA